MSQSEIRVCRQAEKSSETRGVIELTGISKKASAVEQLWIFRHEACSDHDVRVLVNVEQSVCHHIKCLEFVRSIEQRNLDDQDCLRWIELESLEGNNIETATIR